MKKRQKFDQETNEKFKKVVITGFQMFIMISCYNEEDRKCMKIYHIHFQLLIHVKHEMVADIKLWKYNV